MKVSVILPIYNGEKTLAATLDSLANQSFKDFELVVCIDGTHDGSKQILENWKAKFQSVQIFENEANLGLGPTMNRLTASCKGEYVAVAEQDDFYYPNRLEIQVNLLDSKPEVGMVSGISEFWDGSKVTSAFPGLLVNGGQYPVGKEMFLLNYRNQIKVVNSCMMFRKVVHIEHGLYFTKHYPSISVDWTYVLRFSLVSRIYGLNEVLVRLDRTRDRNSVTSNKEIQFKASRELLRSFAYEYPEIISKEDHNFAIVSQRLLELSGLGGFKFVLSLIRCIILNPWDKRWMPFIVKRVKRYFNKKMT